VSIIAAIKAIEKGDAETLKRFNVQHANAVGKDDGLVAMFGPEARGTFVVAVAVRLQAPDDDVTVELLRAARNLLRETSAADSNMVLASRALQLFVPRLTSPSFIIRDEAIKCLNNSLVKNPMGRDALLSRNDQVFDVLAARLAPGKASNCEAQRICAALMNLFSGPAKKDEDCAGLLVTSRLMEALVDRLAHVFQVEVSSSSSPDTAVNDSLSGGWEGRSRAQLLTDGLRVLYAIAVYSTETMLVTLMGNQGKPPLQGEALARADLATPGLGVGDQYVFLLLRVLLCKADFAGDVEGLDKVKRQVCSLLLFGEKAPGFFDFLHAHGVARPFLDLMERSIAALATHHSHDVLLPVLAGLHALCDANERFVDDLRVLLLSNLLDELDPNDFDTEEVWKQALERRHFQGHSRPGTQFHALVSLLTNLDEHIKRFAGEIVWRVCGGDAQVVTKAAGFGHAAHLLAIKGGMLEQMMANAQKR